MGRGGFDEAVEEGFVTKDSGVREEYASGMVRDTQQGKPRYDLLDRPFLRRWAELMARGADKYGEDNWRNAASEEELARFKASATRHLFQWLDGDRDEDHAAAVAFNLAAAEYVESRLSSASERVSDGEGAPVRRDCGCPWPEDFGSQIGGEHGYSQ